MQGTFQNKQNQFKKEKVLCFPCCIEYFPGAVCSSAGSCIFFFHSENWLVVVQVLGFGKEQDKLPYHCNSFLGEIGKIYKQKDFFTKPTKNCEKRYKKIQPALPYKSLRKQGNFSQWRSQAVAKKSLKKSSPNFGLPDAWSENYSKLFSDDCLFNRAFCWRCVHPCAQFPSCLGVRPTRGREKTLNTLLKCSTNEEKWRKSPRGKWSIVGEIWNCFLWWMIVFGRENFTRSIRSVCLMARSKWNKLWNGTWFLKHK